MNSKDKNVILPTDENAARYLTNIKGWVDINNRYFGEDERAARYSSSTHHKCECGKLAERNYTKCPDCIAKQRRESYYKLPLGSWDGNEFVYSTSHDQYFRNEEELTDYCYDNEITDEDLMLVLCTPNNFTEIEYDEWQDIMPEDVEELPKKLTDALEVLNAVIRSLPPASYSPGKIRIEYKIETLQQ